MRPGRERSSPGGGSIARYLLVDRAIDPPPGEQPEKDRPPCLCGSGLGYRRCHGTRTTRFAVDRDGGSSPRHHRASRLTPCFLCRSSQVSYYGTFVGLASDLVIFNLCDGCAARHDSRREVEDIVGHGVGVTNRTSTTNDAIGPIGEAP